MERKTLQIELKADRPGHLEAVFSRFNVIDHDGDITLADAFTPGETVRLLPAHDWTHYAIGKGTVRVEPDKALFDGDFFLSTTAGRDWYESVKALSDIQEFSYGFDILDSEMGTVDGQHVRILKKLRVHEVSPVTLGAGIETGVLAIKSQEPAPEPEPSPDPDPEPEDVEAKADRLQAELTAFHAELKEGRVFSAANLTRMAGIADELTSAAEKLRALIAASEAEKGRAPVEIQRLFERFSREDRYYEEVAARP